MFKYQSDRIATMERQTNIWNEKIQPLFDRRVLAFQSQTSCGRKREVNLDHAATTPPFLAVEEAVNAFLGSYGSVHRGAGYRSMRSTDAYEQARERIRRFCGASDQNYVVFTANTTGAINQAAELFRAVPGKVLLSDIEHSSNRLPWERHHEVVWYRTTNEGIVDLDEIEKVFKKEEDIKLLTITGSSNVTGYRPPLYDLASLAHRHGAQILVDVCQLIPHHQVDILPDDHPSHLDFIAFSGHKMYAPFGAGVLVGPKSFFDCVTPYQLGGGNLPYITRDLVIKRFTTVQSHDPGTPNAMGALAIASAIDVLADLDYNKIQGYESVLVKEAWDGLCAISGVQAHVPREKLGSVLPFDISGFDPYLVAEILAQEYGIGVRAGSFCTYELIRKMKNISDEQDRALAEEVQEGITRNIPGMVRASFSLINRCEDVSRFVSAVDEMVSRGSGFYGKRYRQDEKTGRWRLNSDVVSGRE